MTLPCAIDFERYPIGELDGAQDRAVVARCRAQVARDGIFFLPRFLRPAAVAASVEDALSVAPSAYYMCHEFLFGDGSEELHPEAVERLADDDPRRYRGRAAYTNIARDEITPASPIHEVYDWDGMTEFVRTVMQCDVLYRYADPLASLTITVAHEGDELNWHFDNNAFTVTILLQNSEAGGNFEYVPGLRAPGRPDDYAALCKVHDGSYDGVIRPPVEAGTLTLFKGRYNYHRASPVIGPTPRVLAVLSYDEAPDCMLAGGDPELTKIFYGRSA